MKGGFLLIKSAYDITSHRPTGVVHVTPDDRNIAMEMLKE